MRALFISLLIVSPVVAQSPTARVVNLSHPASSDFQIGDRFKVTITGTPNQPVSVRTTMQMRTDWGPVIGATDSYGQWSLDGQFQDKDFGGWSEIWTVGGKLAQPVIQFSVNAPCLPGGHGFSEGFGASYTIVTCDTAHGQQTFTTPPSSQPFRTPDGRVVPGRPESMTSEQYQTEILEYFICGPEKNIPPGLNLQSSSGGRGDEVGDLIQKLIGVNALSESETRNVLLIVRATFSRPESIAPSARIPSQTMRLLWHLMEWTDQPDLKRQIATTIAYLEAHPFQGPDAASGPRIAPSFTPDFIPLPAGSDLTPLGRPLPPESVGALPSNREPLAGNPH